MQAQRFNQSTLQLFTVGHTIVMTTNITLLNTIAWHVLTSIEVPYLAINAYKFLFMFFATYFFLSVLEVTLIRYLKVFVWKKITPIDTRFMFAFMTIFNILISILVSGSRFLTNEDFLLEARFLGIENPEAPKSYLKLQ